MINAIKYNKVNRDILKTNEDSLTSFIFEKLNYLPRELFKFILTESITNFPNHIDFNTIKEFNYWPHWNPEKTENKNFVEPDIFIRFNTIDLIIEAKRYDEKQQNKKQWRNEIKSYLNEFSDEKNELIFIALGGINDINDELLNIENKKFTILKCKWSGILNTIIKLKDDLKTTSNYISANLAITNILEDMILAFAIYGFSTAYWFEKFDFRPKISNESIELLINNNFNG